MVISLFIHTASNDAFLASQGVASYFDSVLQCLSRQTIGHAAFEFIYVDRFYEANKEHHAVSASKVKFQVKHVPLHEEHRYWYSRGHCYISAAKNTGILYADGELCVTCDDAEFFPDDLLSRYWNTYKSGRYLQPWHTRLRNISTSEGRLVFPIDGNRYINDHRHETCKTGRIEHPYGEWGFAGASFSLGDALELNGFNERMDGCKSLEDCEFGIRLAKLGRGFVLHRDAYLYILDHQSYSGNDINCGWAGDPQDVGFKPAEASPITNLIAIENFGFCSCARELGCTVANKGEVTDQQFEIIRRETLKYRQFDPLSEENAARLAVWRGTPTFDLRSQRAALRQSPQWRW